MKTVDHVISTFLKIHPRTDIIQIEGGLLKYLLNLINSLIYLFDMRNYISLRIMTRIEEGPIYFKFTLLCTRLLARRFPAAMSFSHFLIPNN